MFIIGALVKLFSLFGVYAAAKESRSLLKIYAFLMSFLVMCSFGIILHNSILRERYEDFHVCNRGMYVSELKFNSTNQVNRDLIQKTFKCCGWTGPNDYKDYNSTLLDLPESCFKVSNNQSLVNCNQNNETRCNTSETIYQESCSSKLIQNNKQWKHSLYAIVLMFTILAFISTWLSLYFASKINNKKRNRSGPSPSYHHLNRRIIQH